MMNTQGQHPATMDPDALLAECTARRQRRSGPGGQHRNKVETGVFLRHSPTGIEAAATEKRSQASNHRVAVFRLRLRLAIQHRTSRESQGVSALWRSRCRGGRLEVAAAHDDFPALVAEALDVLAEEEGIHTSAAQRLGISGSQLVKFLKKDNEVWAHVVTQRKTLGLSPLR